MHEVTAAAYLLQRSPLRTNKQWWGASFSATAARLLADEAVGDLAPGDQRRHGLPVARGLADGDEVRLDPEALVAPHRVARAAVPALRSRYIAAGGAATGRSKCVIRLYQQTTAGGLLSVRSSSTEARCPFSSSAAQAPGKQKRGWKLPIFHFVVRGHPPRLDLVRDPQPARLVRRPHEPLHVRPAKVADLLRGEHAVEDGAREPEAFRLEAPERGAELAVAGVEPAVGVVRPPALDVGWEVARGGGGARGEGDCGGGDAVVRPAAGSGGGISGQE